MHRAVNTYFQTQMTTTTQGDVLLSLYDAAIRFLTEAKERIDAKDPAGKGNLISKTLDIIAELDGTLNIEKGKDLAQNLRRVAEQLCPRHSPAPQQRGHRGLACAGGRARLGAGFGHRRLI